MSEQPGDTLSRRWWPGQWLRIVYGVWVDQLWYWQNVRPRLRGRTEGWAIFAQAALGAALVTVLVAAPVAWAVRAVVPGARGPLLLLLGGGLGLLLPPASGVLEGRLKGVAAGLAFCLASAPVVAILSILFAAVHLGGGWDALVGRSLGLGALWGVGLGLTGGFVRGIYEGLTSGTLARMKGIAGEAVFFGIVIVGGIVSNIAAVPAGAVAFVCGWWAGRRWSTRQVGDEEARRRLANPEERHEHGSSQ